MLSRKTSGLFAAFLLALVILAACVAPQPELPTAPTSAVPTEAPAGSFVPAPVPPPTDELRMLRANSWQWVSYDGPTGRIEVEDPASYRVTFNTDASLAITADCNNAAGSYQGESGKLTIEIEPVTMADCSPQSYSNKFIDTLAQATRYDFDGADLRIELADGGVMRFAPVAASAGPATRRTFGVTLTMPAQPARPDLQPHEGSL